MSDLPTADDFIPVVTHGRRTHFALAVWPQQTLCGFPTRPVEPNEADDWPVCKQCLKSRARRMEGRRQ